MVSRLAFLALRRRAGQAAELNPLEASSCYQLDFLTPGINP